MIKIINLTKIFKSRNKRRCIALNNLSFTLPDTGFVFIIGKSGSGKSTLLNVLGGLDDATRGKIIADGNNIVNFSQRKFNMYHDTVAVLEECGIIWETNSQSPCASAMLHQRSVIEHYLWEVKGLEGQVSLQYNSTNPRD